jgi:hypothetical protein
MRDKDGWQLSKKQAQKYLEALNGLYGTQPPNQEEISSPRSSQEVLEGVPASIAPAKRKKQRTCPKERHEQRLAYEWTQTVPALKRRVMALFNDQQRSVARAAIAKLMGLLPGASDLFIAKPVGQYYGLWVEMKQNRSYPPSERRKKSWMAQEAFQADMREEGYAAVFAFGADHAIKLIKEYMNSKAG